MQKAWNSFCRLSVGTVFVVLRMDPVLFLTVLPLAYPELHKGEKKYSKEKLLEQLEIHIQIIYMQIHILDGI